MTAVSEEELARQWLPWALCVARKAAGGAARYGTEAEDRESDAALGLALALRSHDPARGPLGPWIALLVKRCVIDGIRQRAGRTPLRRLRNVAPCYQGAAGLADGDRAAERWRRERKAQRETDARSSLAADILDSLRGGRAEQVMRLRYGLGLLQSEAASRLGVSAAAVSETERRAIAKLRERWQGQGEG